MKNLSFIILAVFISACSKVEKFQQNADSMEKTTKSLTNDSVDVKKITKAQFEQYRSDKSRETRLKYFNAMRDEEGMGRKISAAAIYFESFEFQLWTGIDSIEDEEIRDKMFKVAAEEITQSLSDLHAEINLKKMSPTKSGKNNNDEMNFYALAATVHMNNAFQEKLVKTKAVDEVSMYEMIKDSLIKRHNNDYNLKAFQKPFVNGPVRKVMLDFLKARVDILSALALRNLTSKDKLSFLQTIRGGLFKITGGFFGTIDLPETYDRTDYVTNEYTVGFLSAAVDTRRLLQELNDGQEVVLEKTIKSAYEHISLPTKEDKNDTGVTVIDDTKEEIRTLINHLL
jgi:hypothetical protein